MSESNQSLASRLGRTTTYSIWIVSAVAITALLTLVSMHTVGGNSDGATVVLEGQSLAHGNLLLHGWILSQDSFWSVDAVFYGIAVLLFGVHGFLLHVVPACVAALIILLGCKIATTTNNTASRAVAFSVVTLGLLFPVAAWAQFYLAGPYHLGTTLFCLGAFYLCGAYRSRTRYILAIVLLSAGILGDLQTLSLGVIPLAVAGLIAMFRTWNVRAGSGELIVAAASAVCALCVRKIAELLGAFTLAPARTPATFSSALSNVIPGLHYAANLVGVGSGPFGKSPIPPVFASAHVVELGLLTVVLVVTLVSLLRGLVTEEAPDDAQHEDRVRNPDHGRYREAPHWALDDLLLLGVLGSLSTYAYLATTGSDAEARYLSAGVIFAVILTARVLGRYACSSLAPIIRRITIGIASVVSLGIVAGGIFTMTTTPPAQSASALIGLLNSHHLTNGLGGYWSASIVTVLSDDEITVRPVTTGPNGTVVRYARQSLGTWYQHQPAQFLVYNANVAIDSITRKFARATFGPALHVYAIGPYRVLVYRHLINVSVHGYSS